MTRKLSFVRYLLIAVLGLAAVLFAPGLLQPLAEERGLEPVAPAETLSPERPPEGFLEASNAPPLVPVCKIQGSGFSSPYEGQQVRTQGVVYADFDQSGQKGFYIQETGCDNLPATSDGIFVYVGVSQNVVAVGDRVEAAGLAQEYFGLTEILSSPESITVLGTSQPAVPATDLSPPFDNSAARVYFEALEGMHVSLADGTVVGPTSLFDETWLIRTDLGLGRVFRSDPLGTGEVVAVDGEGAAKIEPPTSVGDRVTGSEGALGYQLGSYRLHLTQPPSVLPASYAAGDSRLHAASAEMSGGPDPFKFRLATFNVENLFDTIDDPATEDTVSTVAAYQRHLEKLARAIVEAMVTPHVIGLQEVENEAVLHDLVTRPELAGLYEYLIIDGQDIRGIDVAFLYRKDLALLEAFSQRQACTSLVDGLGPDGNQDVQNPQNDATCDLDGDGILDGNRLFSRPPLVAEFRVCAGVCLAPPGVPPAPSAVLTLIVNHFKSKTQDTEWNQYTLPRRLEEASFVASLVEEIQGSNPEANLVVLGDLNDYPDSTPVAQLESAGLVGTTQWLPPLERYTYIYQGVSQVLDHVLVNRMLLDELIEPQIIHINVDFPEILANTVETILRSSDHDPLVVDFTVMPYKLRMPFGSKQSLAKSAVEPDP